jgi:hypothetical protein
MVVGPGQDLLQRQSWQVGAIAGVDAFSQQTCERRLPPEFSKPQSKRLIDCPPGLAWGFWYWAGKRAGPGARTAPMAASPGHDLFFCQSREIQADPHSPAFGQQLEQGHTSGQSAPIGAQSIIHGAPGLPG